jgi:DNA topoisomerase-1
VHRLLVAEKFSAALRLATVLSEGKAKRLRADGVSQFTFSRAGDEWRAFPLRGHFLNLDYPPELNDWDRTDLDALIDAEPVPTITDPETVQALRSASESVDEVVVATDYDREGELIGLEAVRVVHEVSASAGVRRARFSALTRPELVAAFENLGDLDERLATSAATREVVDLAWGAVLTRFLSLACNRRGRDVLSVGRVQTPTLALLEEREREIEESVPTPWWRVVATFARDGNEFRAEHAQSPFWHLDEAEAARGLAGLATEGWIASIDTDTQEERPPVPLNTTLFIALASRDGFTAARAMAIAESLYRDGLISYPRTDNTVYPRTMGLRRTVEELLDSDLAEEAKRVLALPEIRPTRGRTASTDHPPIYPTGAARRAKLKPDAWRVYEAIARRFLATLSPSAVHEVTTVQIDLDDARFIAMGRRVVNRGWREVLPSETEERSLPDLGRGGGLEVRSLRVEDGETPPPPRFSQGSLIQEMERLGLGTKSTRHEIVQKLYDRGYVGGRRVRPTESGRAVVEALIVHAPTITRSETTADLESRLEAIAQGTATPAQVVAESREKLREALRELRAHGDAIAHWIRESLAWEQDHGACEKCGTGRMMLRKSWRGTRFLGCSNYPQCKNSRPVPRGMFVVRAKASEASLAG